MSRYDNDRLRRLQRVRQLRNREDEEERPRRRQSRYIEPQRRFSMGKLLLILLILGTAANFGIRFIINSLTPETTWNMETLRPAEIASYDDSDTPSAPAAEEAVVAEPEPVTIAKPVLPEEPEVNEPQPLAQQPEPSPEESEEPPAAPEEPEAFASVNEASDYIRSLMPGCPETITIRMAGGATKEQFLALADVVAEHQGCFCPSGDRGRDDVILKLEYSEDALFTAVIQGRISPSRLSAAQTALYEKAQRIVRDAKAASRSEYELALALHDWIVLNSKYVKAVHPDGPVSSILIHGEGLCDCYARSFYVLALIAGLECHYVDGPCSGVLHAWNIVKLDGKWVHVDCTYDDPTPDKGADIDRYYFGLSDSVISQDHQWNRNKYPACTSGELWHAYNKQPHYATLSDMAAELVRQNKAEGATSLTGYVEEIDRHPERINSYMKTAVSQNRLSLSYRHNVRALSPGFITLFIHRD